MPGTFQVVQVLLTLVLCVLVEGRVDAFRDRRLELVVCDGQGPRCSCKTARAQS